MIDSQTKKEVEKVSLLTSRAGPLELDQWPNRLAEEYQSLIQLVNFNKESDADFFSIEANEAGTIWTGTAWHIHNSVRYSFAIELVLSISYPFSPPEIRIPELDGLSVKMYRNGLICTSSHFEPLWRKNAPKFGIAHALTLGLKPWLSVEIPLLVEEGKITPK
ncbi:hypothetical protein H696_02658 [Fonticula alba]|uniref:Ubiquitin-fold modifier-conjugating enzyme 1 n=1 Tax=Fonticula alba TaxID=691883 RepID=A0A058Z880_FONAL|nr:hypothetical protein H696_02658 [Fonticula alba]KCV70331.1 hypothetical protein H696_02658 [Fonticula alba]|eukprot:XP_009494847.1 hypothetical protein H696_02658 [Fonticula alba]